MKSNFAILLLSVALATSVLALTEEQRELNEYKQAILDGFKVHQHPFDVTHFKKENEHGSESIVRFDEGGMFSKKEHHTDLLDAWVRAEIQKEQREHQKQKAYFDCENDERPDFLKMSPLFVGGLNKKNTTFSWKAPCFQDTKLSINFVNEKTIEILHVAASPKNLFCTDAFFYSSLLNHHVEIIARRGTHKITLKVNEKQYQEIAEVGLQVFRVCDKTTHFFPDLIKSLMLFVGGFGLDPNIPFFGSNTTEKEIERNVAFMNEAWGYKWQKRPLNVVVDLDESLIQSGDFFAVIRFDGLDPIIGYGSGSHAGHSTMALRYKGEVYIVESQSGWYWPRNGIQMNPYKTWVKWARNAGFHVTHLPLKKEIAAKFNETAAWEYFKSIEGLPYGYHNFMWGWLDTPDHSYPSMLSPEFLAPAFAIVEKISPIAAYQVFGLPMNMRLGTVNLTVAEVALEAAKRGLRMQDLYAMVEQDDWVYPDGISRVCSSFVVDMYRAAGLFGDMKINSAEFTPRDLYMLDFIDPNPPVQEVCMKVDPTNPYCQIMGQYRMEFPGISTVAPYPHMNEHCWTEDPLYERVPQGC